MAVRWIPGSGLQSYAPEAVRKQYIKKTFGGGGGGSGSSRQSIDPNVAAQQAAAQAAAARAAAQEAARQEAARKEAARQEAVRQAAVAQKAAQTQVVVSAATLNSRPISFQETRMDQPSNFPTQRIIIEPTIEKRQVSTYRDETTGKDIPITETFLLEPPGKGGGQVKETRITPTQTPSGEQYIIEGYEPVTIGKDLVIVPLTRTEEIAQSAGVLSGYKSVTGGITGAYEDLNIGLKESITDPTLGKINFEGARTNVRESTEFLKSKGVPGWVAGTGEFISGAGLGLAEDIKYKPLKYATIYAATAGVGFAVGATTTGVTAGVTSLFGSTAGTIAGTTTRVATVGAGIYLGGQYISSTATRIKAEPTALGKGEIFGVAAGETFVGFAGFSKGTKLWSQTKGLYSTRGREFIEIPQGEYPTAPTSQQLRMFRENIYDKLGSGKKLSAGEELFMRKGNWINLESRGTSGRFKTWTDIPELGKPGAFHTTGEIFWKGGKITPMPGTSELPGLYGSTKISTPFSRIQGSGSSSSFQLSSWFKNLFQVEGSPAVAYLQPEGFRYSATIRQPSIINGQKFSYTWKQPAKLGYADVPGIKTEIEAIFRPEAGGYSFESGKYYTTIKGVRVAIDSFSYDPTVVSGGESLTLSGGQSSYSGYTPSSYVPIPVSTIPISTSSYSGGSSVSIMPSYSSVPSSFRGSSASSYSSSSASYSPSYSSVIKPSSSKSSKTSSVVSLSSSIIPSSILRSSKSSSITSPPPIYKLYSSPRTSPPKTFRSFKLPKQQKFFKPRGGFTVFGRRFGKFKPIGVGRTEREAFSLGKKFASGTLGATFKVPKSKIFKLPGYKTKKTKEGILFIEPSKRRLKRGSGELPEIQFFKQLKGGKKR